MSRPDRTSCSVASTLAIGSLAAACARSGPAAPGPAPSTVDRVAAAAPAAPAAPLPSVAWCRAWRGTQEGDAAASGGSDSQTVGALYGTDEGELEGGYGFGVSSDVGVPTAGVGRYGTIGRGQGRSRGYTTGAPGYRAATAPEVRVGAVTKSGDLDKKIIRRYIKRKLSAITYCYEKQLLDKPNLKGTVSTSFLIGPDGRVSNATASGVDAEVAACIAQVIEEIEFPKPAGGGNVKVNYPFSFRQADDGNAPAAASSGEADSAVAAAPGKPDSAVAAAPGKADSAGAAAPGKPGSADAAAPGKPGSADAAGMPPGGLAWAGPEGDAELDAWDQAKVAPALTSIAATLGGCRHATAPARMKIVLGVAADASISGAGAAGLGDQAAEQCVADAVGQLRLSPPPRGHAIECQVDYPSSGAAEPTARAGGRVMEIGPDAIRLDGTAVAGAMADEAGQRPLAAALAASAGSDPRSGRLLIRIAGDAEARRAIDAVLLAVAATDLDVIAEVEIEQGKWMRLPLVPRDHPPGQAGVLVLVSNERIAIATGGEPVHIAHGDTAALHAELTRARRHSDLIAIGAGRTVRAALFAEVAAAAIDTGFASIELVGGR